MDGINENTKLSHLTITGDLGSGKSSVAKMISKKLQINYISTGKIQRQIAKSKGLNTLELNIYSESNSEIDDFIDNKLKELNQSTDVFILDSRLAWFFIEKSFKIYLIALPEVAAKRVLEDETRTSEPVATTINEKVNDLRQRRLLENTRFKKIYGVDCDKFKNYNLIVDSSTETIENISNRIISEYSKWLLQQKNHKIWLSPRRIFPLENIKSRDKENLNRIKNSTKIIGFDSNFPIDVLLVNKEFFVWNGHHRLSAAISNGIELVPVNLLAKDDELLPNSLPARVAVNDSLKICNLHDWESMHKFTFFHYPIL